MAVISDYRSRIGNSSDDSDRQRQLLMLGLKQWDPHHVIPTREVSYCQNPSELSGLFFSDMTLLSEC